MNGSNRRASLEVLRAEATDERSVLVQERLRGGEDPWDFMEDLPTVDELVVHLLRAEAVSDAGGRWPDASGQYELLRGIALDYPELTPIVWRMLGQHRSHRRWDRRIVGDQSA